MKNLSELIIQMFVSLTLWGQSIFEITFFYYFLKFESYSKYLNETF